jgi:acyl-CoA reductase-like NAD-dependent aldehyde dehydrogenase
MNHTFPETQVYIDGRWQDAATTEVFESINPATGLPVSSLPLGSAEDIDRAVASARNALHGEWRTLDPSERGRMLYRVAAEMRKQKETLALLDTSDMGKPITDSRDNVEAGAQIFEFYAGLTDKIHGAVTPVPGENFNYTLREPVGVVASITPWNFPIWMASMKLAPALACGNAVVLKPAEQSPSSALELMTIIDELGFPPGVVNVVTGDGPTTGAALAGHEAIDHISFTGSSEVGREVAAIAGRNLVGTTLELGGKTPTVVFADADLEQAVTTAIMAICANQGQICVSASRLVIEESIREPFVKEFVKRVERLKVGNPLDEDTHMGTLVDGTQYERVMGYIEQGKKVADLLTGGGPLHDPADAPGYYMKPTVFDRVPADASIVQDEIFGPVMSVIPFTDEEEAIALANRTRYGLAAWIFTSDLRKAHRFAREVEAGIVAVNRMGGFYPLTPYAGQKVSGVGQESGISGAIESYTRVKSVTINLDREPSPWGDPR